MLFGLTAVWHFGLVPRLTQRIPAGWSWQADFIGFISSADPKTGKLPEKDGTSIYLRGMHIVSETGRPGAVLMEATFITMDPATGKKTWEYISRAEVDPQTGAHLEKEYLGDVFVLPRFVEKKTYKFRNNYIKGVPLAFERLEEIEGVQTYLFAYRGPAEYTESYAGRRTFRHQAEPGQEIRCGDDQFIFQAWVEPVTGEILSWTKGV